MISFISCGEESSVELDLSDQSGIAASKNGQYSTPPIVQSLTPSVGAREYEKTIILPYVDAEGDLADQCNVNNLFNLDLTTPCGCDVAGVCTVGVTGQAGHFGAVAFNFEVTSNGQRSEVVKASYSLIDFNTISVADDLTLSNAIEDIERIITLSYTDIDSDLGIDCSIGNETNVIATTACSCDEAGVCTVGITSEADYFGAVAFTYEIVTNGQTSNTATTSYNLTGTDDAPRTVDITPSSATEDVEQTITLTYYDPESDPATSCTTTGFLNASASTPCACTVGICTVGVTGTTHFFGPARFTYTITANAKTSNASNANFDFTAANDIPVANNITPNSFDEDIEQIITLSYSDSDGEFATACNLSGLTNISETTACSCSSIGICTAGITGDLNFAGAASFNYSVYTNVSFSNSASATITIDPIDDPPVTSTINPSGISEDVIKTIELPYIDADVDTASTCSISALTNVVESTPCGSCVAGKCYVDITSTADYSGPASFSYNVTANSIVSNSSAANFLIAAVDDDPVAVNLSPANGDEEVESIFTLSYTDQDGDLGTSCSLSNLIGVLETSACTCNGSGVCSVGITGTLDTTGTVSFDYTITANGLNSNLATVSYDLDNTDDAPIADDLTPAAGVEDIEEVITLTYTDAETDLGTSCNLYNAVNLTETTACSCAAGTCTIGVTGVQDHNGAISFDYTITALGLESAQANVSLTLASAPDNPIADIYLGTDGSEDILKTVTLSYSDGDGDSAISCTTSNYTNVTENVACSCTAGICTVGIQGTLDYTGAVSFDFEVTTNSAPNLTSNTGTVNYFLTASNDPPVTTSLTPTDQLEDIEKIITLLYSDPDGEIASNCTISSLTGVVESTPCDCDVAGVCTVGITGIADTFGAASIDYTVTTNGQESTPPSTITYNILSVEDAPTADSLTPVAGSEDTEKFITLTYSDPEAKLATSCGLSNTVNLIESTTCICTGYICTVGVTGTAHYYGAISFDYTLTSSDGLVSNTASVNVTLNSVDDIPIAADMTPTDASEDIEKVLTLDYLDNDLELATTCSITPDANITETSTCTCNVSGICTVGVTGTANYYGAASLTYTVTANAQVSNTANINYTIQNINDSPIAVNMNPSNLSEDIETILTLDYSDADTDLASLCMVTTLNNITQSTACSCDVAGVCTVGVTGLTNFNGAASFEFAVFANAQFSNTATTNFTINDVDDAPIADNLALANADEDTLNPITLSYIDVDGDKAALCTLSNFSNVTESLGCSCDGAGICTVGVTGTPDYNGAITFDYTITAGGLTSNIATVNYIIDNIDDIPVADNLTPSNGTEDVQALIALIYTDADGELATSCTVNNEINLTETFPCFCNGFGVCNVGVKGTADHDSVVSFDYTITVNGQVSNTAAVNFSLNPVDDKPVATTPVISDGTEETTKIITLSYTDTEGDLATSCYTGIYNNVSEIIPCACDGSGVCTVSLQGDNNFAGTASFFFSVETNGLTSELASASYTINNVDDSPIADNLTPGDGTENIESIIALSYTDPDGDNATTCDITSINDVTVSTPCDCDLGGNCTVGITGTTNHSGSVSFEYTVTANLQVSASALVSIILTNVDNAPVADNLTPTNASEDIEKTIFLTYIDDDSDPALSCTTSLDVNITFTTPCSCNAGVCSVGVTSTSNYNGAASFSYTVFANSVTSNTATVNFTIDAIDDAPVAVNLTPANGNEEVLETITLSYTDVETDLATTCNVSNLSDISITNICTCTTGTCTVGVTGDLNYYGAISFDYTVTANGLISNTATMNMNLTNVPDLPQVSDILPADGTEDIQNLITLPYTDGDLDAASLCVVSSLSNITETYPCFCSAGVCKTGVTGTSDYNGAASFDFTITAGGDTTSAATANFNIIAASDPPVVVPTTLTNSLEDTLRVITLPYTDVDGDSATACTTSTLINISETVACDCDSGVCTISVTPDANYSGTASLLFSVDAGGQSSSTQLLDFTIDPVDDNPIVASFTDTDGTEETLKTVTLVYTDQESDNAASCSISNLNNLTITNACSCTSGGCTVGVTGTADHSGAVSFDFDVTSVSGSLVSNIATASFSLLNTDDDPVAIAINPSDKMMNYEQTLTLSYSDVDGDDADSCSITTETNITVTTPCSCSVGVCTVGVTGTLDHVGSASFDFDVTANLKTSVIAAASYTITAKEAECIASAIPGSTPFQAGAGSLADPYIICTGAQLQAVNGTTSLLSEAYKLGDNIDLTSIANFVPLGNCGLDYSCVNGNEDPFTGAFDGNGKVISNLTINSYSDSGVGLFGMIDTTSAITDIKVTSALIDIDFTSSVNGIGGIIGHTDGAGFISNLNFSGDINITNTHINISNVGGAIGYIGNASSLKLITVATGSTITIENNRTTNAGYINNIGGAIGYIFETDSEHITSDTTISLMANLHSNSSINSVGGLLGRLSNSILTNSIAHTDNTVRATLDVYSIGGLVGKSNLPVISDTLATGTLTIHADAVGTVYDLAGNIGTVTSVSIRDSASSVVITDNSAIATNMHGSHGESGVEVLSDNIHTSEACSDTSCTGSLADSNFKGPSIVADYAVLFGQWDFTNTWEVTTSSFPILINTGLLAKDFTNETLAINTITTVNLYYRDYNSEEATSCLVSNLSAEISAGSCTCASGVCSLDITGDAAYTGAASFDFSVETPSFTSNTARANLDIQ